MNLENETTWHKISHKRKRTIWYHCCYILRSSLSLFFKVVYRSIILAKNSLNKCQLISCSVQTSVKEDDLPGFPCMYQILGLSKVPFYVTRTGLKYHIWTSNKMYEIYIIYYNERLDEVTYPAGYEITNAFTELCEVKVQGR